MECSFKVEDRVVCVESMYLERFLSEGAVYTVAALIEARKAYSYDGLGLHIAAVLREVDRSDGFDVRRFRPVVERGTEKGMSILRDLLNKTDKPARVEA